VAGIFAKETGYGFSFNVPQDAAASLEAATIPAPESDEKPDSDLERGRPRRSHLQVVK
jgi:stringent starvation protein B